MGDGTECGCRPKSESNVLGQGGFDEQSSVTEQGSAVAWPGSFSSNVTWWEEDDADSCPDSGSIRFSSANADQGGVYGYSGICAPVEPGTEYHFGFKYKRQANASFGCDIIFYTGEQCDGEYISGADGGFTSAVSTADTVWRSIDDTTFETPANAGSAQLICQSNYNSTTTNYISVLVDQVYLNSEAPEY